jgi:hypothetical protein
MTWCKVTPTWSAGGMVLSNIVSRKLGCLRAHAGRMQAPLVVHFEGHSMWCTILLVVQWRTTSLMKASTKTQREECCPFMSNYAA